MSILHLQEPDDDDPVTEDGDEAVSITEAGDVRINLPADNGMSVSVTLGPVHAIKLAILITKQAQKASRLKKPSGRH
jgi:hypothetical protein